MSDMLVTLIDYCEDCLHIQDSDSEYLSSCACHAVQGSASLSWQTETLHVCPATCTCKQMRTTAATLLLHHPILKHPDCTVTKPSPYLLTVTWLLPPQSKVESRAEIR